MKKRKKSYVQTYCSLVARLALHYHCARMFFGISECVYREYTYGQLYKVQVLVGTSATLTIQLLITLCTIFCLYTNDRLKIIAAHKRIPSLRKTMRLWIFMSSTQYFITQYTSRGEKKSCAFVLVTFMRKHFYDFLNCRWTSQRVCTSFPH